MAWHVFAAGQRHRSLIEYTAGDPVHSCGAVSFWLLGRDPTKCYSRASYATQVVVGVS
jgi:hypothetical protein